MLCCLKGEGTYKVLVIEKYFIHTYSVISFFFLQFISFALLNTCLGTSCYSVNPVSLICLSVRNGVHFFTRQLFLSPFSDFYIAHFGLLFFKRNLASNSLQRLPKDIFKNLSTLEEL